MDKTNIFISVKENKVTSVNQTEMQEKIIAISFFAAHTGPISNEYVRLEHFYNEHASLFKSSFLPISVYSS